MNLINKETVEYFPKGAVITNVARGDIVDDDASGLGRHSTTRARQQSEAAATRFVGGQRDGWGGQELRVNLFFEI